MAFEQDSIRWFHMLVIFIVIKKIEFFSDGCLSIRFGLPWAIAHVFLTISPQAIFTCWAFSSHFNIIPYVVTSISISKILGCFRGRHPSTRFGTPPNYSIRFFFLPFSLGAIFILRELFPFVWTWFYMLVTFIVISKKLDFFVAGTYRAVLGPWYARARVFWPWYARAQTIFIR